MSDVKIPEDLLRRVGEHGFPNCDCDLVGGDELCMIKPPYETEEEYQIRLIERIARLEQENERLNSALWRMTHEALDLYGDGSEEAVQRRISIEMTISEAALAAEPGSKEPHD